MSKITERSGLLTKEEMVFTTNELEGSNNDRGIPIVRIPTLGFSSKDTGVGCHFLLQCMKVKSESEVVQSCPTLLDPFQPSRPLQPSRLLRPWIFQARVLEWGAIAFSETDRSLPQITPVAVCA